MDDPITTTIDVGIENNTTNGINNNIDGTNAITIDNNTKAEKVERTSHVTS